MKAYEMFKHLRSVVFPQVNDSQHAQCRTQTLSVLQLFIIALQHESLDRRLQLLYLEDECTVVHFVNIPGQIDTVKLLYIRAIARIHSWVSSGLQEGDFFK